MSLIITTVLTEVRLAKGKHESHQEKGINLL